MSDRYQAAIASNFISIPPPQQPTTSDDKAGPPPRTYTASTTAPSYRSSAAQPASFAPTTINHSPFARPAAPSDVTDSNFKWSDDTSTIHPDDSVSQLGRRMTGKPRVGGPRPLPGTSNLGGQVMSPPPMPTTTATTANTMPRRIEEEPANSLNGFQWVPPEMLEDDKSTIVASHSQQRPSSKSSSKNSNRFQTSAALATTTQSYHSPPLHDPYNVNTYGVDQDQEEEEFDDTVYPLRGGGDSRELSNSSAALPLVAGAAPVAGYQSQIRSSQGGSGGGGGAGSRAGGYAAVGENDEEDPYSAWKNGGEIRPDLGPPTESYPNEKAAGSATGGLAAAFSNPLSYVKSLRGLPSDSSQHTYPPDPFGASKSLEAGGGPRDLSPFSSSSDPNDISQLSPDPWIKRAFWDTTPTKLRVWEHKRGIGIQRWPVACWVLSLVMVIVLIVELLRMKSETGSLIQTKPSFNVMIGPSGAVLINVGARFAGCTKFVANVSDIEWTCLSASNSATLTAADVTCKSAPPFTTCTMSDICGFGGFPEDAPNQSFRFILPIFLHAGIVHILLNLLAQLVSSAQIERMMGTPKFLVLYFASGTFGFILGSNFALVGQPSVGASGAIFGTHAAILVDLIAHWNIEYQPKRKLFYLILEIVVGLGLGLVPGVDNFAHIGGFAMGLLMSIVLFPIIHQSDGDHTKQSKRHRYVFYALRLAALPLILVMFIVLVKNFYNTDSQAACEWCRYLSCWPTAANNHCKGTGLQEISTTGSSYFGTALTLVLINYVVPLLL